MTTSTLRDLAATWAKKLPVGLQVGRALSLVWRASPGWAALAAALVVVQGVIPLLLLYVLKLLVDRLTILSSQQDGLSSFGSLLGLLTMAFALAVVGTLCGALFAHARLVQSIRVKDYMQRAVQLKSIELDLEFYESSSYHDKLYRAQQEAPDRPSRIVRGLTDLGISTLTLGGTLVLLVNFHWGVVAAVILASSPILLYRLRYARKMYEWHREKTASERLSTYLNELITSAEHAKEARALGFGPGVIERYHQLRDRLRTGLFHISAQSSRKLFVTESTATLAGFASLAYIVFAALKGAITLGDLVMYFGAFQLALVALRGALRSIAEVFENNLFLSTLYEFLDVRKKVIESDRPKKMPSKWRKGLRVEGLSFMYPGTDRLVLHNIELQIRPGETVALVGRNGSGKTTLAKLLCRLYDPTSGRITIDDIDLREFNTRDLRQVVGAFFQDFGRFHLTARENICLGSPESSSTTDAVLNAALQAGAHEDIERLPLGYDTVLSRSLTEGQELSIGQWQKVALARTILRDSQLIVFDEPTSHLDAEAEYEFIDRFHKLIENRSALLISHRFSTVRLADQICVLEEGRLTERGVHDTLLDRNGHYAELFHKQASRYTDDRR